MGYIGKSKRRIKRPLPVVRPLRAPAPFTPKPERIEVPDWPTPVKVPVKIGE